jgi:hypothetical protein
MHEHTEVKRTSFSQQADALRQGDVPAAELCQWTQLAVDVSHHRKGAQEILTELSIRHPWFPQDIEVERKGIDENRLTTEKLNIQ